jgi:hypothetical protein
VLQLWLEQLPQEWDDVEEPEAPPLPPDEMAQQVTSLSTLALPHFSHFTVEAADIDRRNFSNTLPHLRHL